MKHLFDDRFDDIGTAITNNGQDINLDVININRKILKPTTPIPPLI